MKKIPKLALVFFVLMIIQNVSYGSQMASTDTIPYPSSRPLFNNISIPIYTFAAGSLIAGTSSGRRLETNIRNGFDANRKHTTIDDYTQYAPALLVFAMDAAGLKGRYRPGDQLLMYGLGVISTAAVVQPMKRIIVRERPDGSDDLSFPSGHTSVAFATAEFLNQEYGKQYPWISFAGYATAGLTGYLRLYNDQHWLGDVLAGAAIGMGTTRLVYWIRNRIETKKKAPSLSYTKF